MSERGLLEQASRALRERTAEADPRGEGGGEETLARVVFTIRGRARRRRILTIAALQVGIASVGLGAWAAASGRLEALLTSWRPGPAATTNRAHPPRLRPPAPTHAAPPVAPPPAANPATVPPQAPATPRPRRLAAVTATAPVADEDALYREAHEAHFVRRDFAAALAAWNLYLALDRPPRLAVEARYNRGLALYRLGRAGEAALALRPFADGDYGPYRQREARALLQRLGRPPP